MKTIRYWWLQAWSGVKSLTNLFIELGKILAVIAALVTIAGYFFPSTTMQYVPGYALISERLEQLIEQNRHVEQAARGGKREISDDPVTQLANWGYPLGNFESGQALFLKAKRDQRPEVMLVALKASIELSPEVLLLHDFSDEVWPALLAHQNWTIGLTICEAVADRRISPAKLKSEAAQGYLRVRKACATEMASIEAIETEELQAIADVAKRKEKMEAERQRKANLEARQRADQLAREAANKKKEIESKRSALARNTEACLRYYSSVEFHVNVKKTLVKFILENGKYWDGLPEFEVITKDKSQIYVDKEYIQNVDWLLVYTRANFGVLNNQLRMQKPSTPSSRFQTVDEAIKGNLRDYGVQKCAQLKYRT